MKRILGLDLGTNSIGWAVVLASLDENEVFQLDKIEPYYSDGCSLVRRF